MLSQDADRRESITSLSYIFDHAAQDHLSVQQLAKIIRNPSLQTLELSEGPDWSFGVPILSAMEGCSNVIKLVLNGCNCINEGFQYVFACFKELQVLEIDLCDCEDGALRSDEDGTRALVFNKLPQWLSPHKKHLKRLVLVTRNLHDGLPLWGKDYYGLGSNLRDLSRLERLDCDMSLLTEDLWEGTSRVKSSGSQIVEIPVVTADQVLPENLHILQIELHADHDWYCMDGQHTMAEELELNDGNLTLSYETRRLFK